MKSFANLVDNKILIFLTCGWKAYWVNKIKVYEKALIFTLNG